MRILEVNAYYAYGSTGNIVKDLCEEGEKHGHEMYAIYWLLNKQELNSKNIIYCGENKEPSTLSKVAQFLFFGGQLNYHPQRTQRIIECIFKVKPDIVHLHNLHGDFEYGSIDLEMLFKALAKIGCRVIWTLHDCWPITGRCYHFTYKQCEKWKAGCGNCPQRFYDREGILVDYSAQNWAKKAEFYNMITDMTVVTVSNWLHSVASESILKNYKIQTIYNGIDTDVFTPNGDHLEKRKFRILCIGWDRKKGFKDYYKLAKTLKEDEEIAVVGYRPFFRKLKFFPRNIKELRHVSSKESMAQIYRSSDVYFNASPCETFGLTTVEALSCGTPVIGYRNTATIELLECAGDGGHLVNSNDISNVREAIDTIRMSNDLDKNSLHRKCEQLFSRKQMLTNYMELYCCNEK